LAQAANEKVSSMITCSRWPTLALAGALLAGCSKSGDQSRHFLFSRSDSQTVHDAAITKELAQLKISDPEGYLHLLRTEKGDVVWLDALRTVHPDLYKVEFDKWAGSAAPSSVAPRDTSPGPSSGWEYTSTPDEMRGKATESACIESETELHFAFPYNGGSRGELCFRRSPKFGDAVYLTIQNGQFLCSQFLSCHVRAKFDQNPIWTLPAAEAADGSMNTIFIRAYGKMMRSIKKSKKLIVEANFYQAGEQQLEFDVSGFNWK
jgi:hypothetical protein